MYKLRIGSFSDLVGARLNLPMKSWSYTFNSFLTRFFSFWSSSNENPTRCFPWIFDVSKLKVNIDQYYDDIKLVDTLVYDGQEIESDGGDGNIHHDFYCWINCGTRT